MAIEASWQLYATVLPPPEDVCPPKLWAIINRLWARKPEARFESMREVADTLHDYLREIAGQHSDEVLRSLIHHPQMTPKPGAQADKRPEKPLVLAKSRVELPENLMVAGATAPSHTGPRRAAIKHVRVELSARIETTTLVIFRDGVRTDRFILGDGATVGRDLQEADIAIDDRAISRKHLSLTLDPTNAVRFLIVDLGSRNGVEINGQRIQSSQLWVGEFFEIGGVHVQIVPPGFYDPKSGEFRGPREFAPPPADAIDRRPVAGAGPLASPATERRPERKRASLAKSLAKSLHPISAHLERALYVLVVVALAFVAYHALVRFGYVGGAP